MPQAKRKRKDKDKENIGDRSASLSRRPRREGKRTLSGLSLPRGPLLDLPAASLEQSAADGLAKTLGRALKRVKREYGKTGNVREILATICLTALRCAAVASD